MPEHKYPFDTYVCVMLHDSCMVAQRHCNSRLFESSNPSGLLSASGQAGTCIVSRCCEFVTSLVCVHTACWATGRHVFALSSFSQSKIDCTTVGPNPWRNLCRQLGWQSIIKMMLLIHQSLLASLRAVVFVNTRCMHSIVSESCFGPARKLCDQSHSRAVHF